MSENADDLEAHSWPGFVDILSAAIMMFVFFVLVTAVALFFHVITYTSKEDPITATELEEAQAQVAELEIENEELRTAIGGLQKKIVETESQFSETEGEQRISWSDDGMSAVIFFGGNSITTTQATDDELKKFTEQVLSRFPADKLKLNITSPRTTSDIDTIARKVAVARIFNVRNSFLETALDKEQTFLNVLPSQAIEDEYDWAKVQFEVAR